MTRACSLLVVLLFATSCSRCAGGDDAVRAAAERAHVQAKQNSSLTLAPYKAVKLLLRSQKLAVPVDDKITADDAKALAAAVVHATTELKGRDEDEFPLLWNTIVKKPLPAAWYENGSEHLALATAWVVIDVADGATAKKVPAHDVIFYESFRAKAAQQWPRATRAWAQLMTGVAYAQGEHHYAADEDLTAYLAALESEPITEPLALATVSVPAADAHKGFRAAGHFARAWNRMGMNRDDAAAADLKEALKDLEGLGIDNELTQWAWAFVHAQQGNFEESAAELAKLAQSPHIDQATRAEILADAAMMRTAKKKVPILGKVKAGAILGQALLKRAGGFHGIASLVTGNPEAAKGLEWLKSSRDHLASNVSTAAKDIAGARLDAVKNAIHQLTDAGPAGP